MCRRNMGCLFHHRKWYRERNILVLFIVRIRKVIKRMFGCLFGIIPMDESNQIRYNYNIKSLTKSRKYSNVI